MEELVLVDKEADGKSQERRASNNNQDGDKAHDERHDITESIAGDVHERNTDGHLRRAANDHVIREQSLIFGA